jgi:hypothetical protein
MFRLIAYLWVVGALLYSIAVVLSLGLGFLFGITFIIEPGYSFGHAVPSLLASAVASHLNRKYKIDCLGLPKILFHLLLSGGWVILLIAISAWVVLYVTGAQSM